MNKHYCCTDLHSMGKLWDQIKNYCDKTDTIYFLGDAADRGDEGLRVMRELLQDKRVIFIKGNHEDILTKVAEGYYDSSVWKINGGNITLRDYKHLPEISKHWYLRKISNMPDYVTYTNIRGQNIILSHAGVNPWDMYEASNKREESPWQWNRTHFYRDWSSDSKWDNTYVIHGHTPVQYLISALNDVNRFKDSSQQYIWNEEILNYADGHKFDLDLGSFQIGKIALFDLDELKVEKYFYDLEVYKKYKNE